MKFLVAVIRYLLELRVDSQHDHRIERLRVKAHGLDLAHGHPGDRHGRPGFQIAYIGELRLNVIAALVAELQAASRQLGGKEKQRCEAEQHEQSGSDLERAIGAHGFSQLQKGGGEYVIEQQNRNG